jgi:3-oxoacyl-[acyl-carrier protein] reductase
MQADLTDKRALITGASRGVGAALAEILAQRGADVVVNYRDKRPRAEAVAERVQAFGRRAVLAQADITSPKDVARMMREAEAALGGLDLLVLNASGGLEKGQAPDYAMRLNRDAQLDLMKHALPLMPPGSRIIFVTSHLAHFYGEKPVLPGYEPVAESKRAGEQELRARIPVLDERSISLVVVSGDLIEGTITPKLLQRASPGLIEARRQQAGGLPTTEAFATAIADAAGNMDLESGVTVYVGSVN